MELCTTEVGTGFSSSLIPISTLLHYSFKTGEEEKQREGADYKKVDQGKLGGGRGVNVEVKGKGPGIKRPQREECKISSQSEDNKYEHRLMSLGLKRKEKRRVRNGVKSGVGG